MKRRSLIGLAAALVLLVAGCGQGEKPVPQPSGQQTGTTASQPQAEQPVKPQAEQPAQSKLTKKTIAVYYADNDLTALQKEEQEIAYADDLDKYKKAIALLEKPKQEGHNPLWKDFHYHSVTFDKGTLTIDADSKNVYNLGSSGEAMAIDALKQTLFQFDEVKRIVILEDGKPAESLMGHVDITEPLTRDSQ
jgi:hypothetical protein